MPMDREDRDWLDEKFQTVHGRITGAKEELTETIHGMNVRLEKHITEDSGRFGELLGAPCKDVRDHVRAKHDPYKNAGYLAALMGIASTIGAFFMWLFRKTGS